MIATLSHSASSKAARAGSALALFACLLAGSCGDKQEPPAADAVDLPDPGPDQASVDQEEPGPGDGAATDAVDVAADMALDQQVPDGSDDAPQDAGPDLDASVLPDGMAVDIAGEADTDMQDVPDTAPADVASDATQAIDCENPNLIIQPTALPDGSSCTEACPSPYPCVCGVCPWVQTPKLLQPRYNHRAVWTGTEVLVIGGTNNTFDIYDMTGERWNPASGKGFEKLPWPKFDFDPQYNGQASFSANWTGSEVIVHWTDYPYKSFRFNPTTNEFKYISGKNRPYGKEEYAVWAGGRLFHWGEGKDGKAQLGLYDPTTDTWETVPQPHTLLPPQAAEVEGSPCTVASGDDVFVFDPLFLWAGTAKSVIWPNGQDSSKETVSLRFHLPTKTFSYVGWPMPAALRCGVSHSPAAAFPDGFIVWGRKYYDKGAKESPEGAVYWKKSNTWTKMAPSGSAPTVVSVELHWVGGRFAVFGDNFANPKKDPDPIWSPAWPRLYDPYTDTWTTTTPIGAPNDERGGAGIVHTGTELMILGGSDGPGGAQLLHADGVRLHMPPTNNGGSP